MLMKYIYVEKDSNGKRIHHGPFQCDNKDFWDFMQRLPESVEYIYVSTKRTGKGDPRPDISLKERPYVCRDWLSTKGWSKQHYSDKDLTTETVKLMALIDALADEICAAD